jgi:hypothetical protein
MIAPGWAVVGADGRELGTVHEVLGDTGQDIFNGLAVSPGRFRDSRYVPAERVAEIVEGRVTVALDATEFEHLDEAAEQPLSAHIRPDTTDIEPD